jgi:hypothetical protein
MATEKEIKVLKKIYKLSMADKGSPYKSIHYLRLIDTIFSEEIIKRYRFLKVQRMACTYLGRMARKDLIQAEYNRVDNYAYFEGYYISNEGIKIIRKLCSGS